VPLLMNTWLGRYLGARGGSLLKESRILTLFLDLLGRADKGQIELMDI
jgi:hypothetical protein